MANFSLVDGDGITLDEAFNQATCATEEDAGGGSWFARIQHEFLNSLGKQHLALLPGCWIHTKRRFKQNSKVAEVVERHVPLPMGWAGAGELNIENREEVGWLQGQNCVDVARAWKPKMLEAGLPEADVDNWIKELVVDVNTLRIKTYWRFHVCTARIKQ